MVELCGNKLLDAIQTDRFQLEVVPKKPVDDPADTDIYEIVMRIGSDEISRLEVWKTASGGVEGDGRPRLNMERNQLHVMPGERLQGGFVITCDSQTEADTLGKLLWDRLDSQYEGIEVDAAVPDFSA